MMLFSQAVACRISAAISAHYLPRNLIARCRLARGTQPRRFRPSICQSPLGIPLAEEGKLVTCGIVPVKAETGYGYIQQGAGFPAGGAAVKAFAACPDESIDYAVMENTADAAGNSVTGDVITEATSNTLVRADHRLVAA